METQKDLQIDEQEYTITFFSRDKDTSHVLWLLDPKMTLNKARAKLSLGRKDFFVKLEDPKVRYSFEMEKSVVLCKAFPDYKIGVETANMSLKQQHSFIELKEGTYRIKSSESNRYITGPWDGYDFLSTQRIERSTLLGLWHLRKETTELNKPPRYSLYHPISQKYVSVLDGK